MLRIISGYLWWTVPLCVFSSVLIVLAVARGGSLWASHRKYSVLSSQACIITQRKTFPQLSSAKLHHWAAAPQERVSASSRSLREALSLVLISCVLYLKEIVLFWSRAKVLFFLSWTLTSTLMFLFHTFWLRSLSKCHYYRATVLWP